MSVVLGITNKPRQLGVAVVAIGILAGVITVLTMIDLRLPIIMVMFVGLVVFLPTLLLKDAKAYWLFLLAVSIPFDIYKSLSRWIVAPEILIQQYGPPTAGNLSMDFFLTDAILIPMVLQWLVRLCINHERPYFPTVCYLFVFYLAWALIGCVTVAVSPYAAYFEWCRQLLYFLSFLYLINNLRTRKHLRIVVAAIFVGFAVASTSVIAYSALGVGTGNRAFDFLFSKQAPRDRNGRAEGTMYVDNAKSTKDAKRSEGIFAHPAIAACYIGLTAPFALAFLVAARRRRDVLLFGGLLALGYLASYLTYSRAGLLGLVVGSTAFFLVGRWAELISRRTFMLCVVAFVAAVLASLPFLIPFLETRPASYHARFAYAEIAIESYWHQPILGVGLNNGSSALKYAFEGLPTEGPNAAQAAIPCHYLVILIESEIVGFLLFFGFFGKIIAFAFQSMRTADLEAKVLLAGIIGGLSSLAFQNLGDNPLAGHSISALVWLLAGLIVVTARLAASERKWAAQVVAGPPLIGGPHTVPALSRGS